MSFYSELSLDSKTLLHTASSLDFNTDNFDATGKEK